MKTMRQITIFTCLLWLLPQCSFGDTLETERQQFVQAEKALKRNSLRQFSQFKDQLKNYPLYPYLEYEYLMKNLDREHMTEIQVFLNRYPDLQLTNALRHALIKKLSKRKDWQGVVNNYIATPDIATQCQYLYAAQNLKHPDASQAEIKKLWFTPKSLPNECDPVLKQWLKTDKITNEMIWTRLNSIVTRRKSASLAKHVSEQLTGDLKPLGQDYIQVVKHPKRLVSQKNDFLENPNHYKRDIIATGLFRMAYKKPSQTLTLWETYQKTYSFTKAQQKNIVERLARGFSSKNPANLKLLLSAIEPSGQHALALEYLIRYAISQEDWHLVRNSIRKLPKSAQQEKRWQYWYARSLEKTGNRKLAFALYKKLSHYRNYYGFLAAAKLKKPYPMHNYKLTVDSEEYKAIQDNPAISRIHELMILGRKKIAFNEWRHYMSQLSEKEKYVAAQVAYDNFWPYLALRTAARAKHQDDLELRFPRIYRTFVKKAEQKHKLQPALLYAMIRQESFFKPDAVSYAGARGLMQLMPQTAIFVAKMINMKRPKRPDLYRPAINIKLGTAYISHLLNKFNQNIILAVAAYNAGPHRVNRWMPEKTQAADIWVESIPFHETREYVKYVTTYMLVYQYLTGDMPSFDKIYQPIHR